MRLWIRVTIFKDSTMVLGKVKVFFFFFCPGVFYARKLSRVTQTFVIIFALTISCEIVEKTHRDQFGHVSTPQIVCQEGKAEPIFERAVKQLPYASKIWYAYAEWCEVQDGFFSPQ